MGSDHDEEHHEGQEGGDPREGWIYSRAQHALNNVNEESWDKMKTDEDRNDRPTHP